MCPFILHVCVSMQLPVYKSVHPPCHHFSYILVCPSYSCIRSPTPLSYVRLSPTPLFMCYFVLPLFICPFVHPTTIWAPTERPSRPAWSATPRTQETGSGPRTSPRRPLVPGHGPHGVARTRGALPPPPESCGHPGGYLGRWILSYLHSCSLPLHFSWGLGSPWAQYSSTKLSSFQLLHTWTPTKIYNNWRTTAWRRWIQVGGGGVLGLVYFQPPKTQGGDSLYLLIPQWFLRRPWQDSPDEDRTKRDSAWADNLKTKTV